MNNLFKINQKVIIVTFLFLLIIFGYLLLDKNKNLNKTIDLNDSLNFSYDILNPKFTINNIKQNIVVSANEGNFINSNKILLRKNVSFKSNKFLIKSSEVYFNKKNESAFSNKNSKFISDKTSIKAEGFEITNKGDKILFNGQVKIILKK